MTKLKVFMVDAYNELAHRITWPDRKSLQTNTLMVALVSVLFSLLIFFMDKISTWLLEFFFEIVK